MGDDGRVRVWKHVKNVRKVSYLYLTYGPAARDEVVTLSSDLVDAVQSNFKNRNHFQRKTLGMTVYSPNSRIETNSALIDLSPHVSIDPRLLIG
jgi:hypothetical protein